MRININLATQPYEDAKLYLARWGSMVVFLFVVTIALLWFTVHSVRQSSDINHKIAQMQGNIDTLDREKTVAERMLALPQNRGTVDKSAYLNSMFARKAFSWTTVFSDMEKLMPPGLRVLSITPALDAQNQLQVHILVGGQSRDRAIELVRNLEKTPNFRDVTLRSDIMNVQINGVPLSSSEEHDPIKFDIQAQYVPSPPKSVVEAAAKPVEQSRLAQTGANR
jgi:type IV pilus assembly protein PilN